MHKGATFNMEAVKAEIEKAIAATPLRIAGWPEGALIRRKTATRRD